MIIRSIACLVISMAFTACTASQEAKVVSWFSAGERKVVVKFDDSLPRRDFQTHESRIGESAGRGALSMGTRGAIYSAVFIIAGGPYGLMLAGVFMPVVVIVGGVMGAVTAEPAVFHHELSKVGGAAALFETAAPEAGLPTLLKREIGKLGVAETGHAIILDGAPDGLEEKDKAILTVGIEEYSLVGKLEDDPSVSLLVSGTMKARIVDKDAWFSCKWTYGGRSRKLSEWSANEAELFREEVAIAAGEISRSIASGLRSSGRTCPDTVYRWTAPSVPVKAASLPALADPAENPGAWD